jgi:signal transduction histidine kinase
MRRGGWALRWQILLLVIGGAILPLGLVGFWLTSSGVRSGEALLRDHLDASVDQFARAVQRRWMHREADLALVSGNLSTLRMVSGQPAPTDLRYLADLANGLVETIPVIEVRDLQDSLRWSSASIPRATERNASGVSGAPGPRLAVKLPITAEDGRTLGTVSASVALSGLLPADSGRPLVPGAIARARIHDRAPAPRDLRTAQSGGIGYPESDVVTLEGAKWLVAHRELDAPRIDIAVLAPLAPYVNRFERAGRFGLAALAAVMISAIAISLTLTTRMTRPLEDLAIASDAVANGEMTRRVDAVGPRELRRVASAFNLMTQQLQSTLDRLARREALAAVGEFATSLSHDVRNALTSIKVDLDRAALRPAGDAGASHLVRRAMNNVARLESTVTGALQIARSGHMPLRTIDLRLPLLTAAELVSGSFASIPASLDRQIGAEPVLVKGDPAALTQLFANLLFNAVQASRPGGTTTISLTVADFAEVIVSDDGIGMSAEGLNALAQPGYSSKPAGTGLGLPIARQIVAAHGGTLHIDSAVNRGTTLTVKLPRVNESFDGIERSVARTREFARHGMEPSE